MPDDARKDLRRVAARARARPVADVQRVRARRAAITSGAICSKPEQRWSRSCAHIRRLFVGVSSRPDTYLNPFFNEQQWYDYNPGTLQQFRAMARRQQSVRVDAA